MSRKNPKFRRDCKTTCNQNYDPICTLNLKEHKTFPNECELNQYNCLNPEDGEHECFFYYLFLNKILLVYEIKSQGECGVLEGFKCDHYCPTQYEPICAFNGKTHKTFTNDCYLSRFNCLENESRKFKNQRNSNKMLFLFRFCTSI